MAATTRKDWIQPQSGGQGFARTMKTFGRVVNVSVADNVTGTVIGAFTVPAGFVVTSILAVPTDMDSGTAMTISVGDAASGTRFLSASTMGQAGTLTTTALTTATGLLFKYTTETEIQVTITLQATTAVAGTIALYLTGFIDN
jgi:hypothetical protein